MNFVKHVVASLLMTMKAAHRLGFGFETIKLEKIFFDESFNIKLDFIEVF